MNPSAWDDALQAASLLALDPAGLGGIVLRGLSPALRERFTARLRELLPAGAALRCLPPQIGDERLLGGLDLGATLRSGRPVAQRGLLAECDGGLLLAPMAERLAPGVIARLAAALDRGTVQVAREGISREDPCRIGIVALDEAGEDDEPLSPALADRLAFRIDLHGVHWRDAEATPPPADQGLDDARRRLATVDCGDDTLEALCAAAAALGIDSPRAPWLASRVARAVAALGGAARVGQDHAELAARLVLAPRATRLPPPSESDAQEPAEPPPPPEAGDEDRDPSEAGTLEDRVIEAARAAIDPRLLAQLQVDQALGRGRGGAGRRGQLRRSTLRGRPAGVQRGTAGRGARLNLIETLRAAAPWQALRRREQPSNGAAVRVRPDDFRVTRYQQRSRTTTVFAIDASGSAALHRLAEAKGAVELLLADCYVRRDQVAVLAFRGAGAELLLPATRSLVRAKRSLAGLPGGGGTPLAAGLDAAFVLADIARRRGDTPLVVLLTDGRANVARDGLPDRARAEQDALAAAARWRGAGIAALLVDTSPRPEPRARALAERMHARYLPLPLAEATVLSAAVRSAAAALEPGRA